LVTAEHAGWDRFVTGIKEEGRMAKWITANVEKVTPAYVDRETSEISNHRRAALVR